MNDYEMIENLKTMKMLEEYRSEICLRAYCKLEDGDEVATELYNQYNIHCNNAFECDKLLNEFEKWSEECDKVINEIESGGD